MHMYIAIAMQSDSSVIDTASPVKIKIIYNRLCKVV